MTFPNKTPETLRADARIQRNLAHEYRRARLGEMADGCFVRASAFDAEADALEQTETLADAAKACAAFMFLACVGLVWIWAL